MRESVWTVLYSFKWFVHEAGIIFSTPIPQSFLLLLYRRLRNHNWSIVQFTDPFADIVFVHSIQQFSLFPDQFGITFLQSCHTVSDATASRCGEQDDCLVFQMIALDECIDNTWSKIPPDRIADENHVIIGDIYGRFPDGRTWLRIIHFQRTARLFVIPIEVSICIGLGWSNFIKFSTCNLRQFFSSTCCSSCRLEVGYKHFVIGLLSVCALFLLGTWCSGYAHYCQKYEYNFVHNWSVIIGGVYCILY